MSNILSGVLRIESTACYNKCVFETYNGGGTDMTPKFDTDVQELKYKVLKEVATLALNDAMTP